MRSSFPTLTFPNHYSIVTVRERGEGGREGGRGRREGWLYRQKEEQLVLG